MVFWVYILRCSDGSYYSGHTDDLERRMAQHQSGEIPCYASTSTRGDKFATGFSCCTQYRFLMNLW